MKRIIVAIDGFSGGGKSTTAKGVASALGYVYLDSGAMYRAVTWYFMKQQIAIENEGLVAQALEDIELSFEKSPQGYQIAVNGEVVEPAIRALDVSKRVSEVAALSSVRKKLVEQQQQMGRLKGIVMDGRDIGTVVFPEAELKVFVVASLEVRAERRLLELKARGITSSFEDVRTNLAKRDEIDSNRKDSPLRKAEGAVEIDTSNLTITEQIDEIVQLAKDIIDAG